MLSAEQNNLNKLLQLVREQADNYNIELIEKAFNFCVKAHNGQKRVSGEPFYYHPFNVSCIVVSMGMDTDSIVASLLHDVAEDTEYSIEDIKSEFGEDVAALVDGVTKLGKIPLSSREEQQAENLRKMLIAMNKDIRVIIIKLADRLHNMRTIYSMPEQKQRDKAHETLEVYAPIAHRLGIRAVKEELEDISIAQLDPVAYHEIEKLLSSRQKHREQFLQEIKNKIKDKIVDIDPKAQIDGRVKSIHGIYRKMYVQGKSFDEIYDVYAVRVITDTVNDCYNILGLMHDMFRPIPGRFKDYISTPKPNMYQSLHTTVLGREGIPFEIQIRTWDMHHTAEYGIAAHWKYKEGISRSDAKMEERLSWIRQILDTQKESDDAEELIQTIKTDLSQEDVFAVTPKGDVINLPVGATVIDFAFAIHTAVGIKMVGAKADGRIVPITHQIQTGEIIEIITTNQKDHGPSRDWLNVAKTSQARNKIRSWFKKERRTENIEKGKSDLEHEFLRNGIKLTDAQATEFLSEVAKRQKCETIDDLYAAIGYGGIFLSRIIPRIKEDYNRFITASKPVEVKDYVVEPTHHKSSDGVVIEGLDNCLIKISKCCNPLPGDQIIGYITRGHGVSVHKLDCNNVPEDISASEEPDRWVSAYWDCEATERFKATIQIYAIDRDALLSDVTLALINMRVPIHAVNARQIKNGNCLIDITLSAENVEHLHTITARLKKIDCVLSIDRHNQ